MSLRGETCHLSLSAAPTSLQVRGQAHRRDGGPGPPGKPCPRVPTFSHQPSSPMRGVLSQKARPAFSNLTRAEYPACLSAPVCPPRTFLSCLPWPSLTRNPLLRVPGAFPGYTSLTHLNAGSGWGVCGRGLSGGTAPCLVPHTDVGTYGLVLSAWMVVVLFGFLIRKRGLEDHGAGAGALQLACVALSVCSKCPSCSQQDVCS